VRVLFDQGVPVPLRSSLIGHVVTTAYEEGWSKLTNGDLLRAAEAHGYELFLTTDRNLKYQQNLAGRKIAIIVILSTSWPKIEPKAEAIAESIAAAQSGSYSEFHI
jgi:hypothetical protein